MDTEVWGKMKELVNSDDPAVIASRHSLKSPFVVMTKLMQEFKFN